MADDLALIEIIKNSLLISTFAPVFNLWYNKMKIYKQFLKIFYINL